MQWRGQRGSSNIEDRRGGSGMMVGGGIGSVIIGLLYFLLSGDPSSLPQQGGGNSPTRTAPSGQVDPAQDTLKQFVSVVLASTEDVWSQIFSQAGKQYRAPHLVLFSRRISSACGMAGTAMGPFYCPEDQKVYIDLDFYKALRDKLGAGGDAAQAYVVAHEVGHHIQKLLGTMDKINSAEQSNPSSREGANSISVRTELQADFYAGVWAHYAQKQLKLDQSDLEEALNAARAVGDDRLQQQSEGTVMPESFTHGTSAQRMKWFKKGFDTGDPNAGDTFNTTNL